MKIPYDLHRIPKFTVSGFHGTGMAKISEANRKKRDFLIYLLWQSGQYGNKKIGELFGLTYSSVSRRKAVVERELKNDTEIMELFGSVKSLIKV